MSTALPNVPILRFKDEQGKDYLDWEDKKLKQIAKIYRGTGLSKSAIQLNGKFPCILYGELFTKYTEIIKTVFSFTNLRTPVISRYGDILMPTSDVTPSGLATASVLLVERVQLGGDINIIRLNKGICPVFMSYLINVYKKAIMRLVTGTTVKHIYAKDLYHINFAIPTSQIEQQKIATFLSSADTKIEQLTKKKALLEQYKKGLTQKLFNQEIRFQDEPGKKYSDWEDKKLKQIAKIYRGTGLSKSAIQLNGKFPCILYGELFTKYTEIIKTVFSFTNLRTPVISRYGDILMPTSDVTPSGLATASVLLVERVQLGGDINIIRLNKGICPVFMSYLINVYKKAIMRLVTGTTVKHIYAKDLYHINFAIPTSQIEQQKIANFLSAIDEKIELVTRQIKQAQTFKKGLLQQMFV